MKRTVQQRVMILGMLMVLFGVSGLLIVGCASDGGGSDTKVDAEGGGLASTANTGGAGGQVGGQGMRSTLSRSELRERAIAELVAATRSSNAQVRANAIEGLKWSPARLGPVLGLGLRDSNEGVRAVAAVVAGDKRQRAQMGAVRALQRDRSPYVRASAIYSLIAMGDRSIDPTPLGDLATRSSSARVRAHAVTMLGLIGDDSAVAVLRSAAASRMPRVGEGEIRMLRLSVSEALVRLGEDEEIHTLHAALFPSTPDQLEVAAVAAQMLGELGSRRSIPELTNLVVYRDSATGQRMPGEVRMAAARSLGQLGKRDGAFVGLEYVNDVNPVLRAQAAMALGVMRGPEALGGLEKLMADSNPMVRVSAAAGMLEALNGR